MSKDHDNVVGKCLTGTQEDASLIPAAIDSSDAWIFFSGSVVVLGCSLFDTHDSEF